jgi:serine/threonine-protein kinase
MMDSIAKLSGALADRYRIERELGAGGMATVYLAHDVRHDRKVALKVLRPELSAILGADRFLAEIKTTANLQHPHILSLFDSGEAEGLVFYVMPYVEGESLRDRLAREHQLPIDDALRIAREVGDALHYAHGHGVIHRDIKPENILLQGGHALVADFGIALAAAKTGGSRMTETGMSLGTPTYMSPEQAMGDRTLDARSDVYALGCVLYEMLTGDAPFTGSTAQAVVAKVLTEKPAPIIARRERVPPHVEDAVLTALEKLPADRFATAGEFVAALQYEAGSATVTRPRTLHRRSARPVTAARWIGGGVALAILAAAGGWLLGRRAAAATAPNPSRLAIVEPGTGVAFNGVARTIDVSADGQLVVYLASHPLGTRVVARRLDGAAPQVIPNSSDASQLRLSADGRFLYAALGGATMQRLALSGGAWVPVSGIEATPFLSFAQDEVLWWGSLLSFGTHRRAPDGRDSLVFPRSTITQMLPDGRHALALGVTTGSNSGDAQWLDLRTGEVRSLFDTPVVEVRYTMGYLVYVRPDGTLVVVPFDAGAGRITGGHVEIAADVSVSGAGFAQYGVAENGTVAFIPGFNSDLVRVDRNGVVRALIEERRRYHSPRISPDGRRVAFDDVTPDGRDVWLYTVGTPGLTRATFQRDGHDVVWTRDGRGLYYLAGRDGRLDVFRTQLGTTAPPRPESTTVELNYTGTPLAGGAGFLTMVPATVGRGADVVRVAAGGGTIDTLVATPSDESFAVPSPDGRWFVYTSDRSGRQELYLRSLVGGDVQLQISRDGASEPVWSRDGREVFYRQATATGSELVAATLALGAEPRVVSRTRLFDVSGFDTASPHANYDVSPDGRWFVFARRAGADHIVVLQNVPELARRIAQSGGAEP